MLYFLFVCALLSITLFEAVISLVLIYLSFRAVRGKLRHGGGLLFPLLLHALPVMLSTLLYNPSQLGKAVERSLFLLSYPLGGLLKVNERSLLGFNLFLLSAGLLFVPLVLYKYKTTGQPALLWGGWFEVGALYTVFALASLSLFFYSRKFYYLLPFLLFVGVVFFSMRRSAMLGLAFALAVVMLLAFKHFPKRALLAVFGVFVASLGVSTALLVEKDLRYRAVFEVLTGERTLSDETLNIISSRRWEIAKAGIEVVRKDFREGNWLPLLIGHGVNSGYYLEPKSPVGGVYESVLLVSELIEKGFIGLLFVLWLYWVYLRFLLRFKISERGDYLLLPLLLALGSHLAGAVFTFFWDALLPLYLIMFRLVESLKGEPRACEPSPRAG